jgi:hypothetical protein
MVSSALQRRTVRRKCVKRIERRQHTATWRLQCPHYHHVVHAIEDVFARNSLLPAQLDVGVGTANTLDGDEYTIGGDDCLPPT